MILTGTVSAIGVPATFKMPAIDFSGEISWILNHCRKDKPLLRLERVDFLQRMIISIFQIRAVARLPYFYFYARLVVMWAAKHQQMRKVNLFAAHHQHSVDGGLVASILCRGICKNDRGAQKCGGDQDGFHDRSKFSELSVELRF